MIIYCCRDDLDRDCRWRGDTPSWSDGSITETDPNTGVPQAVRTHAAYCPRCGSATTIDVVPDRPDFSAKGQ